MLSIHLKKYIPATARSFATFSVPVFEADYHRFDRKLPKTTTTTSEECMSMFTEMAEMR